MNNFCNICYINQSPEELVNEVLQDCFNGQFCFPLDPFFILTRYHIFFEFREYKNLEGVYIPPDDYEDPHIVSINFNRPIQRQRFTAAHELCHYIKDKKTVFCEVRSTIQIEKFAESFAANLLMPEKIFLNYSDDYIENGYISFDNALKIAQNFGVSFSACVYRLNHFGRILPTSRKLNNRIKTYKPEKQKIRLGIKNIDINLYNQIINNLVIIKNSYFGATWHKFKNDFIYNENRVEQLNVSKDSVSEIVTDLRRNTQYSIFCNPDYEPYIEVAGHSAMFDYIYETNQKIGFGSLMRLHQIFYQYSPHPESGGSYKEANNLITGTSIETTDAKLTPRKIQDLLQNVVQQLDSKHNSTSEFIAFCAGIHHQITRIHPFHDGNGRISRAFLNWMFKYRDLPFIYIKTDRKDEYFQALNAADKECDLDYLCLVFIKEILYSYSKLNNMPIEEV